MIFFLCSSCIIIDIENGKQNMKKRIRFFIGLIVLSILLIGCWAVLAFGIGEAKVGRFSLFVSLVIGTGSLITSIIAVWISIQSYKRELELREQRLNEELNKFIFEHSEEMDFLPYCVYASCYDRHGHHTRKIYDDFCLLNDEMQKELLKRCNYNIELIPNSDWISNKIDIIDRFAKEYGYGNTFYMIQGNTF